MTLWIEEIAVEVERKRIKNMYLRVKPPDGYVSVSAPYCVKDAEVERFVRSRLSWIREKQTELASRTNPTGGGRDGRVFVWGKPYLLQVEERPGKAEVQTAGDTLILRIRPGSAEEKRMACLQEWYRQLLRAEVELLLPALEQRMGLRAESWRIKAMKTRWGTCNVRTGTVWLSLHLAERPKECLEYVIVHELAHLQVPNHGREFWELVERYLPDWKKRRALLNEGREAQI